MLTPGQMNTPPPAQGGRTWACMQQGAVLEEGRAPELCGIAVGDLLTQRGLQLAAQPLQLGVPVCQAFSELRRRRRLRRCLHMWAPLAQVNRLRCPRDLPAVPRQGAGMPAAACMLAASSSAAAHCERGHPQNRQPPTTAVLVPSPVVLLESRKGPPTAACSCLSVAASAPGALVRVTPPALRVAFPPAAACSGAGCLPCCVAPPASAAALPAACPAAVATAALAASSSSCSTASCASFRASCAAASLAPMPGLLPVPFAARSSATCMQPCLA